jgi:hypothetical protein
MIMAATPTPFLISGGGVRNEQCLAMTQPARHGMHDGHDARCTAVSCEGRSLRHDVERYCILYTYIVHYMAK